MKPINFDKLAEQVRNWGRWGPQDQRGTLNHIGPETLRNAALEIRSGKQIHLGLNFDKDGPQLGVKRFNPMLYVTDLYTALNPAKPNAYYSDDVIHMPTQASTQWDALGHVHYDGMLYNGCKACDALSERGTTCGGVEHLATPGIVSRSVLLDIARLKGVDILPDDYAITIDDLEGACDKFGVKVQTGDIVLVRTGHLRRFTVETNRQKFNSMPQPGVSHLCAEWVYDKKIAAICADNLAVEVITPEIKASDMPHPFHMLCLRDMGCPLGEMFNLETLSADCLADGHYSFMLAAPPLAITGAFGSPVNPIVLK